MTESAPTATNDDDIDDHIADDNDHDNDDYTVAIIGGGSAAEELIRRLSGSDHRVIVFEPALVGGECPFIACMPSKAMLHDRSTGRTWSEAVARRDEITAGRDDSSHAEQARDHGATLVRERAQITGERAVTAAGVTYRVDHIVVATGAASDIPDIDGLAVDHDRVWTSEDALTAVDRPESVVVIGGGVIGSELAFMLAGYGVRATTIDMSERTADDMHPRVSELIERTLTSAGVEVVNGAEIARVELTDRDAQVHLADGSLHSAERILVAVGRTPRHSGLGLDRVGVDPSAVEIDDGGRIVSATGLPIWFVGDAAGRQQYTHVANHHAAVVADHLTGTATRRYDDVVVPACIFLDPPVMVVGPSWADLADDDDVAWAEIDLDTPRNSTDEHGDGFLAVAARRSTGCVVAANGIGAHFDELAHALVIAIDGGVPVSRLTQSMQPFPTVGEVLGQAFSTLADQLDSER